MAELFAYNEKVETIVDLIGDRENDITKSIAWAFVKCRQCRDPIPRI